MKYIYKETHIQKNTYAEETYIQRNIYREEIYTQKLQKKIENKILKKITFLIKQI